MLHRALCSLIFKKGYEAISIRGICNAANVGRSTFYAHYTSKDDLKRCGFEPLRRLLLGRQRDALTAEGELRDRRFGFTLAMFEHARDHRNHYRALVGNRGGVVSLGTIRKILSELVRDELAATSGKNSTDTIKLAVEFVVGAFMAVMTWCLDGGATLPPRQVDTMFRRLAIEGATPSYS
jgi:AcrR family transcriptional regulator